MKACSSCGAESPDGPAPKTGSAAEDAVVAAALDYVRALFSGDAGGHDPSHTLRVYRCALRIASREGGADRQIVALAALLHDADDHKLFATEGNANARRFLTAQGLASDRIERVCAAINEVSFSRNRGKRPSTPEAAIVQDADRLDALGAVGVARTFAYGGAHGRPMEDSLAHFRDKLLLLRGELNTDAARELATPRHAFLEQFLAAYARETEE